MGPSKLGAGSNERSPESRCGSGLVRVSPTVYRHVVDFDARMGVNMPRMKGNLLPRPKEVESGWAEKIERAKQAREQAQKLRERKLVHPASRAACGYRHR